MNSSPDLLTIGDVAQASGKAASSLRYYERIGLLSSPRQRGSAAVGGIHRRSSGRSRSSAPRNVPG
jgi:hypothetical protein